MDDTSVICITRNIEYNAYFNLLYLNDANTIRKTLYRRKKRFENSDKELHIFLIFSFIVKDKNFTFHNEAKNQKDVTQKFLDYLLFFFLIFSNGASKIFTKKFVDLCRAIL